MSRRDKAGSPAAGPELLVLARWETFAAWALEHTARWPKHVRFHLVQHVMSRIFQVQAELVEARFEPPARERALKAANLALDQLRFLFRAAKEARIQPAQGFETAMRALDETGRMIGAWRKGLGGGPAGAGA